jgi:hypothetical protein
VQTFLGAWRHVTRSYTQSTRVSRLYIDGVEQTPSSVNYNQAIYGSTANALYLGRRPVYTDTKDAMNLMIDEVRIWNRVLSAVCALIVFSFCLRLSALIVSPTPGVSLSGRDRHRSGPQQQCSPCGWDRILVQFRK